MSKTFVMNGQTIKRAPGVTEKQINMSIEEIEELYAATRMTPEEMAETLHLPLGYVLYHYGDDDLDWIEEYDSDDWIDAKTGKFIWDE